MDARPTPIHAPPELAAALDRVAAAEDAYQQAKEARDRASAELMGARRQLAAANDTLIDQRKAPR